MKTVFVTGASGFVGQNLVSHLLDYGYSVTASFRTTESLNTILNLLPTLKTNSNFKPIIISDFLDSTVDLKTVLKGHEYIIHLAARVHQMKDTSVDPEKEFDIQNVKLTSRLAEAACSSKVKRFVFISTIKVNGESTKDINPFKETDAENPTDHYSYSKFKAELILKKLHIENDFETVILRPSLIYGKKPKGNLKLLINIIRTKLPLPFASINNKRSLLSVFNLCDVIRLSLDEPKVSGEVLLVADPIPYSLPEILNALALSENCKLILFKFPKSILLLIFKMVGLKSISQRLFENLEVNIEKTMTILNWNPRFNLSNTLENKYLNNYAKNEERLNTK